MRFRILFSSLFIYCSFILAGTNSEKVFVDANWLENNLSNPDIVVLSVARGADFEEEHIPNARIISLRPLIAATDQLRDEMPEKEIIEDVLKSAGINNNSTIVISYRDQMGLVVAPRLLLTLDYAGFKGRVHILNGGLPLWKKEGYAVESGKVEVKESSLKLELDKNILINSNEVLTALSDNKFKIIDARPEDDYAGRNPNSHWEKKGHITGAVNLPFYHLQIDEELIYKNDQELKELFEEIGIASDSKIITYCGTGIWACTVYLAARQLNYDIRLYDGSFQEWSADSNFPVTESVDL